LLCQLRPGRQAKRVRGSGRPAGGRQGGGGHPPGPVLRRRADESETLSPAEPVDSAEDNELRIETEEPEYGEKLLADQPVEIAVDHTEMTLIEDGERADFEDKE